MSVVLLLLLLNLLPLRTRGVLLARAVTELCELSAIDTHRCRRVVTTLGFGALMKSTNNH